MFKTLMTLLLAFALTTQTCTNGCLKCTTDSKCTLCDISQNYKLLNDSCSIADQPNCALINLDGSCLVCDKNYYYSSVTSKCVAVETANVVTNCILYNSSQICTACDSNFYIDNGKCVAPTTLITNCDDYLTATLCESCKNGYYLSLDSKTCTALPGTANCFQFSQFKCETCETGYVLNSNLYFLNAFSLASSAEKFSVLSYVIDNVSGSKDLLNNAVCQAVQVTNCKVYEDYKKCSECNAGYFLKSDQTCQAYPIDIIQNCLTYTAAQTCSLCNQGFYLSQNACIAVTTVDNCSQYSQVNNECSSCNADYYRQNSSTCTKRVNSLGSLIANCKTKSSTLDRCSECNTGFNLSSDGIKCFTNETNCLLHNAASSSATSVTCNTCIDGYYLTGTVCTQGTDANCVTYNRTSSACETCKNGFYHPGNTCVEQINIGNCQTYSQTAKNTCVTCQNNTYNFLIDKYCVNRTIISNCAVYNHGDSSSTCDTCEEGYKKDGDSSCVTVTTSNCAVETNNECTKCKEGFALFEYLDSQNATVIECKEAHEFLTAQCETVVYDDNGVTRNTADVTCSECKKDAFTIDHENAYACINDDYLKVDPLDVAAEIEGCLKMDSATTCDVCNTSKSYLSNNREECLSSGCGTNGTQLTYNALVLNDDGNDKWHVEQVNHCQGSQEENVLLKAPDLDDFENGDIAIKCLDDKPAVVTINQTSYTNVNPNGSIGNWINSPMDVFPKVACPSTIADINEQGNTNLVNNCEYYFVYNGANATEYGCIKCKHGTSGKVSAEGFIEACNQTINNCETSTEYKNLNVYWRQLLSCHKCGSNQIPMVAGLGTAEDNYLMTKFQDFTLEDDDWTNVANNGSPTNFCLNVSSADSIRSGLHLPVGVLDAAIVSLPNCGAGFLNLSYATADFDSSDIAETTASTAMTMLCAACKPGYKAASYQTGSNDRIVTSCTQIANCISSSTWFNACSQCATNYTYEYTGGSIKFDSCVSYNKDSNCLAYETGATECRACKKGYYLNRDNYCIKVEAPQCKDSQYIPFYKFDNDGDNARYHLYANQKGAGCNECQSGFTAYKYGAGRYAQYSCATFNYIQINMTSFPDQPDGSDSVFINNCESYTNVAGNVGASSLVCAKCNANYVKRDDGSECLSLATVSNCTTAANTGSKCILCNDGYGLLTSGICVIGSIANCEIYNVDDSAAVATCEQCSPGYYLDNNTCLAGGVAHCKVFGTQKYKCDTCEDGYHLVNESQLEGSGTSSHNYCYPKDSALNCAVATINSDSLGGRFTCTECDQAYGYIQSRLDTEAQTNCLSFNLIDNCKTYDLGTSLSLSTLYCTECNTGYYYDSLGSICIKRTVLPSACKTYNLAEDKCAVCNDGNYLANNNKECIAFPTGIIGCEIYSDASTCTKCDPDRWLNGNLCPLVENAQKVANCLYYSNATTCSQCQSNYFLSGNTCTAMTVQNCLTVAAVNACQTCLPGFVLKTENGNTNCVSFTKANCAVFDQTGTYPCTQCNQNFYVDANGDCQTATIIANCLINDTKDTCSLCGQDYALAVDKKSCIDKSSFDINCAVTTMPSSLNCSMCSPGYYFSNGVCTAFTSNTYASGCFSSSPFDNTVCFLCNTGYYMTSNQSCVRIDDGSGGNTSSVYIAQSLILMIVSLFLMLQVQLC